NAGEIVFDKFFMKTIKEEYPVRILAVVKGTPILNDATVEDAKFISLTDLVQVIESNDAPGIILSDSTAEFKEHFLKKDGVILSKGQGNFESLYDIEIPNKDIYYLLKAKCNLMERIFGVKIGDLIFKKK
ncbi:MAG: ARMT1-like domain-containing protein, partial [Candidatus Odinarchaeota archaeon]